MASQEESVFQLQSAFSFEALNESLRKWVKMCALCGESHQEGGDQLRQIPHLLALLILHMPTRGGARALGVLALMGMQAEGKAMILARGENTCASQRSVYIATIKHSL